MRKWFKKLLKAIEEANKKNFGDKKINFDDLNKNNRNSINNKHKK